MWLILLRILAPAFALWIFALASYELVQASRSNSICTLKFWNIRSFIFAFEAPSSLLLGLALAFGNFGPTVLPIGVHSMFQTLLTGTSVMTTVMVTLFLREESRHRKMRTPRKSIWKTNRLLLCFIFVVTVFYEVTMFAWILIVTIMGTQGRMVSSKYWEALTSAIFVVSIPIQLAVSVYFLKQAHEFRGLLRMYLWPCSSDFEMFGRVTGALRHIGHLSFWLAMSATFMVITSVFGTLLTLTYTTNAMTQSGKPRDVLVDFLMLTIWVFSRLGICYSHVRLLIYQKKICSDSSEYKCAPRIFR